MTSNKIQPIPDDLRAPAVLGDVDRAMQMLRGMGVMPTTDRVDVMVVEGAPWSKSRPRFSRAGHAYQPRDDRAQAEALASRMRGFLAEKFPANVAVACIFFRPNRQRIDADNMLKHVLDSATGVAWEDDSQVTAVLGVIELDAERPRTVIAFGEHESTMTRGTASNLTCEGCGASYPRKSSGPQTRYCSPECSNHGRGTGAAGSFTSPTSPTGLTRERDKARAEVDRLRAGLEALAESFEEDVDWSSGRGDYGDNAAYEACARRARDLLNPTEGENR